MIARLSHDIIRNVLQPDLSGSGTLQKSEDDTVEYKKSFSFDDKIMKTCAAFANCRGGYIVFGIEDQTRSILGLDHAKSKRFDEYDLADATARLNSRFTPTIRIGKTLCSVGNHDLGVIYVYESNSKPVIATSSGSGVIREGDVFYSYGARRERIKYAELDGIIRHRVEEQMEILASQVQFIAKRGPSNIAQFDLTTGDGTGHALRQFAIDEETLSELKVVKEGSLSDEGAPALRLVADVTTIRSEVITQENYDIDKERVVDMFLDQLPVDDPRLFLTAICKHEVTYSPMYYFAHLAGFSMSDLQEFIRNVEKPRQYTVEQLLKRLDRESGSVERLPTPISSSSMKATFLEQLQMKDEIEVSNLNFNEVMESIMSLKPDEIDKEYTFGIARSLYRQSSGMGSSYRTGARKVICHLDRALYPLQD